MLSCIHVAQKPSTCHGTSWSGIKALHSVALPSPSRVTYFHSLTHSSPPSQVELLSSTHLACFHMSPLSCCDFSPTCPPPSLQATEGQTLQKSPFLHPCVNKYLMSIYCVPDT